jgi:hypothetical protein
MSMADQEGRVHESWGAAVILSAGILAEAARFVLQRPWPRVLTRVAYVDSAVLVVIWGATLAALLLRRRVRWSPATAWVASVTAPLAMLLQGVVTRVAGDNVGLLYVPAAVALAVGLDDCFRRWERIEASARRDARAAARAANRRG